MGFKRNKRVEEGKAYHSKAVECYYKSEIEDCMMYCKKAIEILKDYAYCEEIVQVYNILGALYTVKGNELVATNHYLAAIDYAIEAGNTEALLKVYNNIIYGLMKIQSYEDSLHYIDQAIELINEKRFEQPFIGTLYGNAALIYAKIGNLEKAQICYGNAKQILSQHTSQGAHFTRLILGVAIKDCSDPEDRHMLYQQLFDLVEQMPLTTRELETLLHCIQYVIEDGELDMAIKYIECIEKQVENFGVSEILLRVYDYQAEIYEKMHNASKLQEIGLKYAEQSKKDVKRMRTIIAEAIRERVKYHQLKREHVQVEEKVRIDYLTGLYNRYYLSDFLEKLFDKDKEGDSLIGVALLDIDYFKEYNDHHDHLYGDECVQSVADVLKTISDPLTSVFRYGGDEFIVIFIDQTLECMLYKVDVIRRRIRELNIKRPTQEKEYLSVTQGVYINQKGKLEGAIDFVKEADHALYKGKENRGSAYIKIYDKIVLLKNE